MHEHGKENSLYEKLLAINLIVINLIILLFSGLTFSSCTSGVGFLSSRNDEEFPPMISLIIYFYLQQYEKKYTFKPKW